MYKTIEVFEFLGRIVSRKHEVQQMIFYYALKSWNASVSCKLSSKTFFGWMEHSYQKPP